MCSVLDLCFCFINLALEYAIQNFLFFFKTIKNASKLRGAGLLENLETMPDDAGYHRRCYSS